MIGPIFDYYRQRWTEINTSTDGTLDDGVTRITADGVPYEVNPDNPELYRNSTSYGLDSNGQPFRYSSEPLPSLNPEI